MPDHDVLDLIIWQARRVVLEATQHLGVGHRIVAGNAGSSTSSTHAGGRCSGALQEHPDLEDAEDQQEEDRQDERSLDEGGALRSEEHTSELQSLMRSSYAVFCLK